MTSSPFEPSLYTLASGAKNIATSFWESCYVSGDTRWDLASPAPAFAELMQSDALSDLRQALTPGKILVPGAGRGHDAAFFASHGYDVTAVDIAASAVEAAKACYPENSKRKGGLTFELADLFALPDAMAGTFDYVLEHTCFCAIHPDMREAYVESVRGALKPEGRVIGVFWDRKIPGGPPFGTTEARLRELFTPYFTVDYYQPFAGQRGDGEYLVVMTRR